MRNRAVLYFSSFILTIVGFLIFDYSLRAGYVAKRNLARDVASAPKVDVANTPSALEERANFSNRFSDFVVQMKTFSDEPEASEEYLNQFSQTIKDAHIPVLGEILNDSRVKNNERTLALELLIMNQDFNAHTLLINFVQNENFQGNGNIDFEIALRAQAIEGLTLFNDKKLVRKNLENLKIRTKYAFLYSRADRALEYLSDQNSTAPGLDDAQAAKR